MFGEPFFADMSGCFVLLCLKHRCNTAKNCADIAQAENESSLTNPFKTKISSKIKKVWLDGEMVIIELDYHFPLFVVVKLPCHTENYSWKVGDIVEVVGELQFQTVPQLDLKTYSKVVISGAKIIKEDSQTNDCICAVDTKNILSCQDNKKSS